MLGTAAFTARMGDFGAELSIGNGMLWLDLRKVIRVWAAIGPAKDSRWDAWTEAGELEIRLGRLTVIITPRAVLLREEAGRPDPNFPRSTTVTKDTKRPRL